MHCGNKKTWIDLAPTGHILMFVTNHSWEYPSHADGAIDAAVLIQGQETSSFGVAFDTPDNDYETVIPAPLLLARNTGPHTVFTEIDTLP
jgi:hypothetical protein